MKLWMRIATFISVVWLLFWWTAFSSDPQAFAFLFWPIAFVWALVAGLQWLIRGALP
jgi:hypothetical protein